MDLNKILSPGFAWAEIKSVSLVHCVVPSEQIVLSKA